MKNASFTGRKAVAIPLARCARVPRATAPSGRSSWQGGSFAPRCIPQTRSFAPWTTPRRSASGHLTGGDFALPTAPIDQAYAAMDLHEGCAPIDRSGAFAPLPPRTDGRAAPVPLPNRADWMRPDLRPQEAIGVAMPRRGKS